MRRLGRGRQRSALLERLLHIFVLLKSIILFTYLSFLFYLTFSLLSKGLFVYFLMILGMECRLDADFSESRDSLVEFWR